MKVTAVAKPASHAKHPKAKKKKATKARSKAGASKKHKKLDAHQLHLKHEHEEHLKHEAHVAHEKARGLALAEGVACCSAEALAASLRLAGGAVSDDDVLELHWRAGGSADEGVSILAALEAASVFGLAGFRPTGFSAAHLACGISDGPKFGQREDDSGRNGPPFVVLGNEDLDRPGRERDDGKPITQRVLDLVLNNGVAHSLIIGADLPGPHAVLAEPGRWWSWGERYDPSAFPGAVIEECWAVSWS